MLVCSLLPGAQDVTNIRKRTFLKLPNTIVVSDKENVVCLKYGVDVDDQLSWTHVVPAPLLAQPPVMITLSGRLLQVTRREGTGRTDEVFTAFNFSSRQTAYRVLLEQWMRVKWVTKGWAVHQLCVIP
jgi:hypothetical protein